MTGTPEVSNCKNSSSLTSTSGSSAEDPRATLTFGMPVLLNAAYKKMN